MPKKPPATLGIIYRMPLEDLHPHPLNPYGVRDDPAMQELVGSVKEKRKRGSYPGNRQTQKGKWIRIDFRPSQKVRL